MSSYKSLERPKSTVVCVAVTALANTHALVNAKKCLDVKSLKASRSTFHVPEQLPKKLNVEAKLWKVMHII